MPPGLSGRTELRCCGARIAGVRKPFAMATPDYLEQVVISGQEPALRVSGEPRTRSGIFYRPSVTSLMWAALDLLTVAIALCWRCVSAP